MKRLLLVAATLLASASAAYGGTAVTADDHHGSSSCRDLGYQVEGVYVAKSSGTYNGSYSTDRNGAQTGVAVTISNYNAGSGSTPASFDFKASSRILAVAIKAGDVGQKVITYPSPGVVSAAGLKAAAPNVSSILFCFAPCTTAVQAAGFSVARVGAFVVARWRGDAFGYNVYRGTHRLNAKLLTGRHAYRFTVPVRNLTVPVRKGTFRLQVVNGDGSTSWFDGR